MITYFANPSLASRQAMQDGLLGYIDTPAQGNKRPDGVQWCADNGAFSNKWNAGRWYSWLERQEGVGTCTFAVAPDVVSDAEATLERGKLWIPKMKDLGYPVAYVAQDGLRESIVPWDDIDCLFIGGSTVFKLGAFVRQEVVPEALERGKWVHMGRVNSRKRLAYAAEIGCDSADGTYLTFGPEKNLPKLLGWLNEVNEAA